MEIAQAKEIHDLIAIKGDWVAAGNKVFELAGQNKKVDTQAQAIKVCRALFQRLLDSEMYLHAATLQWGSDVFTTEPESVKRSFEAIQDHSLVLFMGASSMGKTYGIGAWYLLDYLRDPYFTTVKLAAVNEDHLKKNLFAHVATLFRSLAIPPEAPIIVQDAALWIGIKEAGYEFGISGLAFKQSQETSGQFKGYKAKPVRKIRHPKFGFMSRLRVLGDEAQNWPYGPFQDFNSLIASRAGAELIKIAVAFNPESTSIHVVKLAEPEEGFTDEGMESLYDYEARSGWWVCRLDALRCENVIQKKIVYPGLQTYEGFMSFLKSAGDTSPQYYCFARGWPPMKGAVNTIIPPSWPQSQRGEAIFIDNPTTCGAVDLAFGGNDSAQMAVGRWGLASGWKDHTGKFRAFEDRLNPGRLKPRHVLQIDQLMPMEKHEDTIRMADEIKGRARMLEISPEWLALDKTSIGLGTYSHLSQYWGPVLGIAWNEKATETKILMEDKSTANEQCEGVMSEMWWAFRRWLDPNCCAVLINPIIPTQPINTQLTSRRFSGSGAGKGKGIRVESKDVYKARNGGRSPDEVDAMIMLLHLVRQKSDVIPGIMEQSVPKKELGDVKMESISRYASIEADDSISLDGSED